MAAGGAGAVGGYGLLVNFGNQSQPPIPPPNTVVASQPDQGSGSINNAEVAGGGSLLGQGGTPGVGLSPLEGAWLNVGTLSGWVDSWTVSTAPRPVFPDPAPTTPAPTGGSPAGPTSTPADTPASSPSSSTPASGPVASQATSTPAVAPPSAIIQAVDHLLSSGSLHHHKARSLHHHRRGH
jgi:hypothetical protein